MVACLRLHLSSSAPEGGFIQMTMLLNRTWLWLGIATESGSCDHYDTCLDVIVIGDHDELVIAHVVAGHLAVLGHQLPYTVKQGSSGLGARTGSEDERDAANKRQLGRPRRELGWLSHLRQ